MGRTQWMGGCADVRLDILPALFNAPHAVEEALSQAAVAALLAGVRLLAAALTHAWMSMRRGDMRGLSMAGLWLATGALFLIMWQVSVGLLLRVPEQGGRRALRRTHFWSMLLIGALLAAHIVLNKP